MRAVPNPVNVSFTALPGQSATGTIGEIGSAPIVKPDKVSYPVRVDLDGTPDAVKLGMSAQVSVGLGDSRDVLVAPASTIHSVNGQPTVTKVGPNGVETQVSVQVGQTYGAGVEIVSGLNEGDLLAVYAPPASAASAGVTTSP